MRRRASIVVLDDLLGNGLRLLEEPRFRPPFIQPRALDRPQDLLLEQLVLLPADRLLGYVQYPGDVRLYVPLDEELVDLPAAGGGLDGDDVTPSPSPRHPQPVELRVEP